MIQKELEIPYKVLQLEALIKRLPETHPKYVDLVDELGRRTAGYRGEKSLSYYLSFLPSKDYHIFHNLRLPDSSNKHFFEIDIFVISPHFILITDSKNYRGKIYFDEQFEQLIQTYEDIEKAYPCPITQINRHELQLKRLLQTNKFHLPPIESLVVFTNSSAIISASHNHKQVHKVIKSTSFLGKIDVFEKRNKKVVFDQKQIQKLLKLLRKLDTPNTDNILTQFDISYETVGKGVTCPNCGYRPMGRSERNWKCSSCGHISKTAHLPAIKDYSLIIGNEISNHKLREFLLLPSRNSATTILKSLKLPHNDGQRNRIYYFK